MTGRFLPAENGQVVPLFFRAVVLVGIAILVLVVRKGRVSHAWGFALRKRAPWSFSISIGRFANGSYTKKGGDGRVDFAVLDFCFGMWRWW